jgi:hypothetical protein
VLKQFVLQIVIKAVNNIIRLNSLISTLLVFSIYSQITTTNTPFLIVIKRDKAIIKTIKQITKLYAKKQVTNVLRQQNRLNISDILNVLINKNVLVYKKDKG